MTGVGSLLASQEAGRLQATSAGNCTWFSHRQRIGGGRGVATGRSRHAS